MLRILKYLDRKEKELVWISLIFYRLPGLAEF